MPNAKRREIAKAAEVRRTNFRAQAVAAEEELRERHRAEGRLLRNRKLVKSEPGAEPAEPEPAHVPAPLPVTAQCAHVNESGQQDCTTTVSPRYGKPYCSYHL